MNIITIYRNSFTFLLLSKTYEIISQSFTWNLLFRIGKLFSNAFNSSLTVKQFLNEESILNRFFSDSFIVISFKKIFFGLTGAIIEFNNNLFYDSFTNNSFNSIRKDLTQNAIKFSSYLILCWITVYVILELIFGAGFTKFEMLIYIFLVIIFFLFTKIEISFQEIIKGSFIIKWIKTIFE